MALHRCSAYCEFFYDTIMSAPNLPQDQPFSILFLNALDIV